MSTPQNAESPGSHTQAFTEKQIPSQKLHLKLPAAAPTVKPNLLQAALGYDEDLFRQCLETAGLAPREIVADGRIHRCGTVDKPHGKNGCYVAHQDEPPSIWWKNWRTNEEGTWTAKAEKSLTAAERKTLRKRIEADKARREAEEMARHAEAADKAAERWAKAGPAESGHAYLVAKGIQQHGLRQMDTRLVVPVLGADGKPQSLQYIGEDGGKRFLTGGKMAGGFYSIGRDKDGPLLIAEGVATAASLHEATGHTTLAAFNCGNLLPVARMARERYPNRSIVICADDDRQTEGNPGQTKARDAAEIVKGSLAMPTFADGQAGTDFNDMASQQGLEAVAAVVRKALTKKRDDDLPPSFSRREDGIYFLAETSDGVEYEWVCSPLRVLGATRDSDGRDWGRMLEVTTPDGQVHHWAMPMSALAGDGQEYRRELLSMGLGIASGKGNRRLHDFLTQARPKARLRCVNRIGWHGQVYALPERVYGSQADETVVLQGGPAAHAFRQAGTLEQWQDEIGGLCVGNSRLVLAVCAALAGPALPLLDMEGGGVHFVGSSSIGKSTALRVGASCLGGGGAGGFIKTWLATANGLEGIALGHNHATLFLDEIGQAPVGTVGLTFPPKGIPVRSS